MSVLTDIYQTLEDRGNYKEKHLFDAGYMSPLRKPLIFERVVKYGDKLSEQSSNTNASFLYEITPQIDMCFYQNERQIGHEDFSEWTHI